MCSLFRVVVKLKAGDSVQVDDDKCLCGHQFPGLENEPD